MNGESPTYIKPNGRVAIVGSRDFPNRALVEKFVHTLPPGITVVSGGARGVDRWAEDTAVACGLATRIFQADWKALGRRAGPIRNAKIVAESDIVIAFWDGRSHGTLNTILTARDRGIPIKIFGQNSEEIPLISALVLAEDAGIVASRDHPGI